MTPSIKGLITRLENAIYQEADGEFRDLSYTALKRRSEAVHAARKDLVDEIERLQQRAGQLEATQPERMECNHG
jgi:hypothetical protein